MFFNINIPEIPTLRPDAIMEECRQSKNAMENWIKAVNDEGIRSPKTVMIPCPAYLQMEMMDGFPLSEDSESYLKELSERVIEFVGDKGFPVFLRTSFTSAKHYWKDSCLLSDPSPASLEGHISELLMYQSLSPNMMTPSIVLRELVPTNPVFEAFDGKMPITQEFRLFADSGKVIGYCPYWPASSIEDPSVEDWEEKLKSISAPSGKQLKEMTRAASSVTKRLGGHWSVDFLIDSEGKPWLIDMADGNMSYKNEIEFVNMESNRKLHSSEPAF